MPNGSRRAKQLPLCRTGLPGRVYPIVLIDVPRHSDVYGDVTGSERAPENNFATLSFRELVDLPIDSFAAEASIIAYWSTEASLIDDHEILAEWGFVSLRQRGTDSKLIRDPDGEPLVPFRGGLNGSHRVWCKDRPSRWSRDQHGILILTRRGDAPEPLPGTQEKSIFDAPWQGHAVKSGDYVRGWIDRCWPAMQKIEVFARLPQDAAEAEQLRCQWPSWTFWGGQV